MADSPPAAAHPSMTPCNVCILGAGCIGLASARTLAERVQERDYAQQVKITIVAEKFHPHTTSNVAAGIWEPYDVKTDPVEQGERWSMETLRWMRSTFQSDPNTARQEMGIFPCVLHDCHSKDDGDTSRKRDPSPDQFPVLERLGCDVVRMTDDELENYRAYGNVSCFKLQTMIADTSRLLPWLTRECERYGVTFRMQTVKRLEDLGTEFDAVINCCGLSAKSLLGDEDMFPARGQVVRVRAPWVSQAEVVLASDGTLTYVIPQVDCVVLGGFYQRGNWSEEVSDEETAAILQRCVALHPRLAQAPVLRVQAGLRPGRTSGMRLEAEQLVLHRQTSSSATTSGSSGAAECVSTGQRSRSDDASLFVVHNYGHAGCGVTVHRGCALDAARLMLDWLDKAFSATEQGLG
ncbi:D-aspartate oxidase-like [Sycon ciliatum]|uniref:D-aspartate oxidase-like n=1 Tax=Sycon ciliatum TaxID=27933 RepID=UPI0020AB9C8D|eukprot:scpid69487/ scgid8757/ D-amino-acid oxidase